MKIIKANINMVDDVYELIQKTIKEVYEKYYPSEAVKYFLELHGREAVSADILGGKVYAAVRKGEVVGTGTADGERIRRVFVLPQFQGRGRRSLFMWDLREGTRGRISEML